MIDTHTEFSNTNRLINISGEFHLKPARIEHNVCDLTKFLRSRNLGPREAAGLTSRLNRGGLYSPVKPRGLDFSATMPLGKNQSRGRAQNTIFD